MKNNANGRRRFFSGVLALLFWLGVWEIAAHAVGFSFALPTVESTAVTLFRLAVTLDFWKKVLLSLCRILLGFLSGTLLGIFAAVLSHHLPAVGTILSPMMKTVRATPVASVIMILWLLIGSGPVPVVIALLMVMPLIYQTVADGYSRTDPALEEVCRTSRIGILRRYRILLVPTLLSSLVPALTNAAGLAFKSGIAAEVIAYTKDSIGEMIYYGKTYLEGETLFAWTITVILLSVALEKSVRTLSERWLSHVT